MTDCVTMAYVRAAYLCAEVVLLAKTIDDLERIMEQMAALAEGAVNDARAMESMHKPPVRRHT